MQINDGLWHYYGVLTDVVGKEENDIVLAGLIHLLRHDEQGAFNSQEEVIEGLRRVEMERRFCYQLTCVYKDS